MKFIDLEQGSDAWHEFRRSHIGASNCAAILGRSRYKTPYMVWAEMIRGEKIDPTAAMERGTKLEPHARLLLCHRHDTMYRPVVVQSIERDWQMASLDAYSGDMAVEIKCPGEKTIREIIDGEIPEEYVWQIQHQMAVTGHASQYLFAYHPDFEKDIDKTIVLINRDEAMIEELNEAELSFYRNFLLEFTPPPLRELDIVNRDDAEWATYAIEYRDAKKLYDELEARLKMLKNTLISLSGGMNSKGADLTLTKVIKAGVVDYNAIPQLKSIDLDAYRKPNFEYWMVTSK